MKEAWRCVLFWEKQCLMTLRKRQMVCRAWNEILRNDQTWENIFGRYWKRGRLCDHWMGWQGWLFMQEPSIMTTCSIHTTSCGFAEVIPHTGENWLMLCSPAVKETDSLNDPGYLEIRPTGTPSFTLSLLHLWSLLFFRVNWVPPGWPSKISVLESHSERLEFLLYHPDHSEFNVLVRLSRICPPPSSYDLLSLIQIRVSSSCDDQVVEWNHGEKIPSVLGSSSLTQPFKFPHFVEDARSKMSAGNVSHALVSVPFGSAHEPLMVTFKHQLKWGTIQAEVESWQGQTCLQCRSFPLTNKPHQHLFLWLDAFYFLLLIFDENGKLIGKCVFHVLHSNKKV